MNDKIIFKISLLQALNNLGTNKYNMRDIKQIIRHFTNRYRYTTNKTIPLWITSYNQGYFNIALSDLQAINNTIE